MAEEGKPVAIHHPQHAWTILHRIEAEGDGNEERQ
jgi:hypothetical protein